MNRILKFRAFGSQEQGMFEVKELNLEEMSANGVTNCKVMQFTGLLDKNGTEIYEGDVVVKPKQYLFFDYPEGFKPEKGLNETGGMIIHPNPIPNYRGIVEWVYSNWQIVLRCVNPNKNGVSSWINNELNEDVFEEGEETYWEVIGNIYQNPELVEASND